jgi:lysophospholipase L1-like esterase
MRKKHLCLFAIIFLATAAPLFALNLMPLGDSLTHGENGFASYRYPLYFELVKAGYQIRFVGSQNTLFKNSKADPAIYPNYDTTFPKSHEGHFGVQSAILAQYIDTWLKKIGTDNCPDAVIILIGDNDVRGNVPVETYTNNLTSIAASLRRANPKVTIVLSKILPINGLDTQIAVFNEAIVKTAAALNTADSSVTVADPNTAFDVASYFQKDHTHPNE